MYFFNKKENTCSKWLALKLISLWLKSLLKIGHLLQSFAFVENFTLIHSEFVALSDAPTFVPKFSMGP